MSNDFKDINNNNNNNINIGAKTIKSLVPIVEDRIPLDIEYHHKRIRLPEYPTSKSKIIRFIYTIHH